MEEDCSAVDAENTDRQNRSASETEGGYGGPLEILKTQAVPWKGGGHQIDAVFRVVGQFDLMIDDLVQFRLKGRILHDVGPFLRLMREPQPH